MMRVAFLTCLLSFNACSIGSDANDAAISTSVMIIAAVVPEPNCISSPTADRLKRGIYDILTINSNNSTGLEYTGYFLIRDQTATGVGSKRLAVEYDFSSNLVQPSSATRSLLRQELTIPFGGWTQGDGGNNLLVAPAPVIPEHVSKILANDPAISAELHRGDATMNTVSGLPAYYTVQIKVQALSLGLNGQWLRSPPYFMTVDLCEGCLTARPEQLAFDIPDSTCKKTQDQIYAKLVYPAFPDLAAKTEGPVSEGSLSLPLITANQGGATTLNSKGAKRHGRSKTGVWLVSPNHAGMAEFPFAGIEVPERNAFATCGVGNIQPGEDEVCETPTYPRICDDGITGCIDDEQCAGGTCVGSGNLKMKIDEETYVDVNCGSPEAEEEGNGGDGQDAGPATPDGGVTPPVADGGLPVVACLYIVCADVDNEVLEWDKESLSWESSKSNCTCYSEDTELAEDGCPL
jgi:hypothetical protein